MVLPVPPLPLLVPDPALSMDAVALVEYRLYSAVGFVLVLLDNTKSTESLWIMSNKI